MADFKAFGLFIEDTNYSSLISHIRQAVTNSQKFLIAYANVNTINLIYRDENFASSMKSFHLIHPDGNGIYIASKILSGRRGLSFKFSGSDFYPILANESVKYGWKLFFFGHDNSTLEKIKSYYPQLKIAGTHEGYNFETEQVISEINNSEADILLVGLGSPKQENWISEFSEKLKIPIVLAVGDGIKVFAGIKFRGPVFIRHLGLEWLARLLRFPHIYWKRYLLGNPLFLYRVFKLKLRKISRSR